MDSNAIKEEGCSFSCFGSLSSPSLSRSCSCSRSRSCSRRSLPCNNSKDYERESKESKESKGPNTKVIKIYASAFINQRKQKERRRTRTSSSAEPIFLQSALLLRVLRERMSY